MTSITIPDSVTSIGYSAFSGCTDLTSITIPDSVTSIGNFAFEGCRGLTKVYWNAKNITNMYNYDIFCRAGQNSSGIDVIFGSNVETIPDCAFCSYSSDTAPKIISVTIPNGVISIGEVAFANCPDLKSITIPDSVTSIGNRAFECCTGLKNVTMSKSIEKIGNRVFTETALSNDETNWENGLLYVGNVLVDAKNLSIGKYTIKSDTRCIADCIFSFVNLKHINVDCDNKYYSSIDGVLYNKAKTTLIQYPCGNTKNEFSIPDSVTSIGDCAFYHCESLTSITIPDSVTSIGSSAFYGCNNITRVNITSLDSWCNIDFCNSTSQPLWLAKKLYLNNELVTTLIIPDDITSIGNYAFYHCESLTSITIPDSVISIGEDTFCGCTSLTSITIPDSVTSIGDDAFYGCKGLTSITIPKSITSINHSAFRYCTDLASVTIPNSVTSIRECAFDSCSSLTSITIPNSVTSIGDDAFSDCTNLTTVYYAGSETQWNKISISSGNSILSEANRIYLTIYTITYIGDYTGTDTITVGNNATLPTPPEGYVYTFTVNGKPWDGKNITENITVTVTKQQVSFSAENKSLSVSGTNIDFDYYLTTNNESGFDGTFYLAAYNKDNRLVGLYKEDVTKIDSEYEVLKSMTATETPTYFKAFFLNELKPLRKNVTKDMPQ